MEQIGRSNYPADKAKQLRFLSPFLFNCTTQNNCNMEQQEVWKDVAGYEGLYQVSNLGRVKSRRYYVKYGAVREKVLKPVAGKARYAYIMLNKNGEQRKARVHRLVAEHFLQNSNDFPCVNHKDQNPLNNRADNLEWCTQKYNLNYGTAREKIADKMLKGSYKSDYMKPIYAFLPTGEFVGKFDNIWGAAEYVRENKLYSLSHGFIRHSVRCAINRCCMERSSVSFGLVWKYEKDVKSQPTLIRVVRCSHHRAKV